MMPQVVFKLTVQFSDSGRGDKDVDVVKICQCLLALAKLGLPESELQGEREHGRHRRVPCSPPSAWGIRWEQSPAAQT